MTQFDNLLFTKEHEWVRIENGIAVIGITDFAQSELGDIIFIELPDKGAKFDSNDVFGTIEAVKTVADLFMPLSGEIIDINTNIEDSPENVNNSPYEEGWIAKVKISDKNDFSKLLSYEDYKQLINV